ncbi:putative amidase-like protein [Salsuginibacillus halophilus]|uniref:Putative amidase-like protein n=1 Tax=Salsuginibacillus halophilus TaxID=517424 RepID=A0A2P8HG96_9BACI|nr:amidase domain-containing protein [Salsuginibacillus halophilus]PSL45216.1 putative amidase-like protein [Salsuginibacillus halophilus]
MNKFERRSAAAAEQAVERFEKDIHLRGGKVLKTKLKMMPFRWFNVSGSACLAYQLQLERLCEIGDDYYLEERCERREMVFDGDSCYQERMMNDLTREREKMLEVEAESQERSFQYNRREAVRYAERWWNERNPAYQSFADNCTNYISQCLKAGGAPMHGSPNRSRGWWYTGDNWSYSWSVAHSMRWYLSGADQGLTARRVEKAADLELGDVICYDFDGDGSWQHTTIVTAKDGRGEPLVNANTADSRHRYWAYEDSTAWTPNIEYAFFHIED